MTAQSAPDETIYKLGLKDITPPKIINHPEPRFPSKYTATPTKEKIRRSVGLVGYVGKDGLYHDAKVSASAGKDFKDLDEEALNAVKGWRFHPCKKDGQPVNCSVYIEIEFHLN